MRVTKNVREYIEREVEKKLMPKYEAEKAEAKRQADKLAEVEQMMAEAAEAAYLSCLAQHWYELEDFCEDHTPNRMPTFYHSSAVIIENRQNYDSVHQWIRRMRDEAKRIVDDIIVTLELGGTRAELEEMLNNI